MPGFTSECMTHNHQLCVDRDCRCECHPWTQRLMGSQSPRHGDPRGGYRRGATQPPLDVPTTVAVIHNSCPQCGTKAAATDTFCRKDGTKLVMGKQCLGCGAPEEPDDLYCWQCGLRAGEKPPEPPPQPTPAIPLTYDEQVAERTRRIEEIKELARKKGILKETVV